MEVKRGFEVLGIGEEEGEMVTNEGRGVFGRYVRMLGLEVLGGMGEGLERGLTPTKAGSRSKSKGKSREESQQ